MYSLPQNKRLQKGMEIDEQILNVLFCITSVGLLPWRLRDIYLLLRGNWDRLAEVHATWYVEGATKRVLMWWVLLLLLANSLWQIAVPLDSFRINGRWR